jgi:hypothetical protein
VAAAAQAPDCGAPQALAAVPQGCVADTAKAVLSQWKPSL